MSLADLACLRDLAVARPEGLGSRAMLAAYARRRHPQTLLRLAGIDVLNRISMAAPAALRGPGLRILHDVAPLRRGLMRLGLGARPQRG
jgi:2-octaprenyl-6-methoxyphenol hydroxylase